MLKNFAKILLFFLLKLIPKKKNLFVFGDRAGIRLADNSRYLFFYLNKNHKEFKCVWITKDKKIKKYLNNKGYYCYLSNSFFGIYFCLRARFHIYNFVENDINRILSEFSDSILLWHGVLPKKLKMLNINSSFTTKFLNKNVKKFFIYPNEEMSSNIINRFPVNKYKLILSNLPRNMFLKNNKNSEFYKTTGELEFSKKIISEKKNIFGYFPTWRSNGLELFLDVKNFDSLFKLNEILYKTNSLILIKKHMNSEKKDKNVLYNSDIENISSFLEKLSNFRFVDYDFDLNSILNLCDVLISDYSGVIFDYLYLDRPIIIYAPDYTEFKKKTGFVFDPVDNNFSHFAQNIDNLNELILTYSANKEDFSKKFLSERKLVKNKVFKNNTEIENIINLLNQ